MEVLDPNKETFLALSSPLRMANPVAGSPAKSGSDSSVAGPETDSNGIKKRPTSLLDLPENVKIRILEYIGLVRPCLINIADEASRAKQAEDATCDARNALQRRGVWATHADKLCDHPRLPTELLMASRGLREDLGALFFSHNRFSAVLCNKSDWEALYEAIDWASEDIRYLHIELRTWDNRFMKPGAQRVLLKVWSRFCKYVSQHMVSLKYFSLKCRVKDLEIALKVMRAMDPFPDLLQCAFHFSHSAEEDIRPLVKRNALRLTGNLDERPPFPYFNLPKEIQLMILEALLVDQWDPYMPPQGRKPGIVALIDRKTVRVNESHPLTCCGTCSPLQALCFCHARQTAYSTTCSCFASPVRYFLVSRAFYEDARRIFFSKNKFAFVEEDPDLMMGFMNDIPTSSFMMIRHLIFKFPQLRRHPARPAHKPHEDSALVSWSVLRRFVREHFMVPRLSLTIVDLGTEPHWGQPGPYRNKYLRKLLKAFEDLRGLRDFRVYLADDREFEPDAERVVMGRTSLGRSRDFKFPFIDVENP